MKTRIHPVADLAAAFGPDVSAGILALSGNDTFKSKPEQMQGCLARIKLQPGEIWMVKLADRITNFQSPSAHWSAEKIERFRGRGESGFV